MQQVIVCAAMRKGDVIVAGARHFDSVMRSQIKAMDTDAPQPWGGCEQGFIDQWGNFLTRREAWKVADAAGQIRRPTGWEKEFQPRPANIGDEAILFSENLY